MNKRLPKMYINKTENKFNNNQNIYSSVYEKSDEKKVNNKKNNENISNYNIIKIEKKIYDILNARDYAYTSEATIVTVKGTLKRKIVGYINNNVITYEDEKIDIKDIIDIHK